ncbi:hypothetical protein FOA52_014821 [Chlamydomonas sp. UWO 241]|nr:hypothetical protein FOA52_014821 [Chlamydomonas sp. UWO 241]
MFSQTAMRCETPAFSMGGAAARAFAEAKGSGGSMRSSGTAVMAAWRQEQAGIAGGKPMGGGSFAMGGMGAPAPAAPPGCMPGIPTQAQGLITAAVLDGDADDESSMNTGSRSRSSTVASGDEDDDETLVLQSQPPKLS